MPDSKPNRILVAVDGSEHALAAVRYVGKTLPPERVEIVMYHVITKVPESFWDLEQEPAFRYKLADIKAWEDIQERLIKEFLVKARQALREAGIPDEAVCEKIEERKAGIARDIIAEAAAGYDAVVVGRRGLSELKDLVLGSIAFKLLERVCEIPVWIVGGKMQRGKFLVAMDTSDGSMHAVNHVASIVNGSPYFEVTLIHVVRGLDIFHQIFEKGIGEALQRDWIESTEKELEETRKEIEPLFREARSRLVSAGIRPERIKEKVVKGRGSRAGTICDEAEQGGYDTIVVGRRGLSRVQEFFMGRVSNKVIQLAKDKTVWVVS